MRSIFSHRVHGHFWPQTLKKTILYKDNYYHIMSTDIFDLRHWKGQFIQMLFTLISCEDSYHHIMSWTFLTSNIEGKGSIYINVVHLILCEDNYYHIMSMDIFVLKHWKGQLYINIVHFNFVWGQFLLYHVHGHFCPQTLKRSTLYKYCSCEVNFYHIMSMDNILILTKLVIIVGHTDNFVDRQYFDFNKTYYHRRTCGQLCPWTIFWF